MRSRPVKCTTTQLTFKCMSSTYCVIIFYSIYVAKSWLHKELLVRSQMVPQVKSTWFVQIVYMNEFVTRGRDYIIPSHLSCSN